MTNKDYEELMKSMARLMQKGGKSRDLALYAIDELESAGWRFDCVSPITKAVVKESFN
jgi:hypothetical protein